jgi:hypothetical protein
LVSILLSMSPSNAFCESIFSTMNCLWTDEKHRFKIETVNAIVSVKENAEFKCSEAFELFMLHSD